MSSNTATLGTRVGSVIDKHINNFNRAIQGLKHKSAIWKARTQAHWASTSEARKAATNFFKERLSQITGELSVEIKKINQEIAILEKHKDTLYHQYKTDCKNTRLQQQHTFIKTYLNHMKHASEHFAEQHKTDPAMTANEFATQRTKMLQKRLSSFKVATPKTTRQEADSLVDSIPKLSDLKETTGGEPNDLAEI